MPVTLSAEEFAKRYGGQGSQPLTLSAEEFAKKYGNVPRETSPEEDMTTGDVLGAIGRGTAHLLGVPTSMQEVKEGAKDALLNAATAGLYGGAKNAVNAIQDLREGYAPIVGRPFEQLMAPTAAYSQQNRPPTKQENIGAIESGTGMAEMAALSSPSAMRGTTALTESIGSRLAKRAGPTYADAIVPQTSELRPLAESVGEELAAKGKTMRRPREELTEYGLAEQEAGKPALHEAVANADPIDANAVLEDIAAARRKLYSEDGAPLRPESDAIAAKIDAYVESHILPNAKAGVIDPATATKLKQNFDYRPYGTQSEASATEAQKVIADALRRQLNADPEIGAANARIARGHKIEEDLAKEAPKAGPKLKGVGQMLSDAFHGGWVGAIPGFITGGPHGGGIVGGTASALMLAFDAGKNVKALMQSPLWKTTSAVMKSKIGRAVATEDFAEAGNLAVRIQAGANLEDEYGHDNAIWSLLQDAMQRGGNEPLDRTLSDYDAVYVNPDGSVVHVPHHVYGQVKNAFAK